MPRSAAVEPREAGSWLCSRRSSPAGVSTRVIEEAFELAGTRRQHVTSVTKSNGIEPHDAVLGRALPRGRPRTPGVRRVAVPIDILCRELSSAPRRFDVVVASNLFGDILVRPRPPPARQPRAHPFGQPRPDPRYAPRCSSRYTARPPTSPARASPTRSAVWLGDDARPSRASWSRAAVPRAREDRAGGRPRARPRSRWNRRDPGGGPRP